MWTRNWDNMKVMDITQQIETTQPTIFGGNSLCLKDVEGNITPGWETWVNNSTYLHYDKTISSSICSLNLSTGMELCKNFNDYYSLNPSENNIPIKPILLFGNSNTEESYNDYTINVIDNYTHLSFSKDYIYKNEEGKKWIFCMNRTIQNNNEDDIIINEYGIFKVVGYNYDRNNYGISIQELHNTNTSSFNANIFLVYREVIPTVTIKPGETYIFPIKIEIPTHN